ncbi:MAG: rod shape-determining protein MreD [Lactobacillus sp.]|jgi:rod shape-determining protein MreD|nr:rod shape-determining protein MreD [Lactobacillus sp.]
MNESLSEHISLSFQRALPLLTSILLLLISYMPMNVFFLGNLKIAVSIACVYFWLLHRSDLFNLFSVCFLGFFEDILSAAPFGSNMVTLLLCYVLITNLAKFFNAKPFVVIWYGFGALMFVAAFSRWLLVSIYYGQFLPLPSLIFSVLITVAVYPLLSMLNAFIQGAFIQEDA